MDKFIDWAKTVDWQAINNVCNSLDDLNDSQYRFLKGRFIELLVEHYSKGFLEFVGEKHKDFNCNQYNCTIELKSEVSNSLYNKKSMRPNFSVIFNNSMGTNKVAIDPDHVTDYLIIIKKDGVILVDKKTILENVKSNGDGFVLKLQPNKVIELSGKLSPNKKYELNIKKKVDLLLKETIINLKNL